MAATGGDLPMADSRGIGRYDTNIIYTCYYDNFCASALAVWHLTLTSTHRTAYAVMVWRSIPHGPEALSKAVQRPSLLGRSTGDVCRLLLCSVVTKHHVPAGQLELRASSTGRMMADVEVIMLKHSEARYRGVQGFVSRDCDGIARPHTV